MTHTPGPWKANLNGQDAKVICPDGRCFDVGDIVYHKDNIANAYLIAAVPELLEALEAVEWVYEREYEESYCPWCLSIKPYHAPSCLRLIAVRKAKGALS